MVAPCNPPATFPPARRNTARASTAKTARSRRLFPPAFPFSPQNAAMA